MLRFGKAVRKRRNDPKIPYPDQMPLNLGELIGISHAPLKSPRSPEALSI